MSPGVLADLWKEEQERIKVLEEKMKVLLREKQVMCNGYFVKCNTPMMIILSLIPVNDLLVILSTTHPMHHVSDVSIRPGMAAHTHTFNAPLPGTTRVSRYQKGKTNLDFTGARASEWQWHQLGHMQVCTSLQTDNHASTPPLRF